MSMSRLTSRRRLKTAITASLRPFSAISHAQGWTHVTRDTWLWRESLYKSLSPEGYPEISTWLRVLKALGIRLRVTLVDDAQSDNWTGLTASALADEGDGFGE